MKTEVLRKAGKKVVLLGNEAIARGALEAGVGVVTAYPGTPSSEVPAVLARVADRLGFYFEYSPNEKVALETAAGAAWCGVRSLVCMKHFGLNVASDSLTPIAYAGVKGGLVIMVADDPQGWSSVQSEQDSRYYAQMARLPELEPANPQECLELTRLAFQLSEEFKIPVLLRTTTKVSHSIGTVKLGELGRIKTKGHFAKDPDRFYNFRPHLQLLHKRLDEKLKKIEKKFGSHLNQVIDGGGETGVITSGVSFEYIKEAIRELDIKPPILKIVLTHPLSQQVVSRFIRDKKTVLVVEELEPILEDFVKIVAKDANPSLVVHGKDLLPRVGEYNLEVVVSALEKVFGKKFGLDFEAHKKAVKKATAGLPPRKPVFCPGCPHRSTFYAVKKVFPEAVYAGDIGCYMMGVFEPFLMQDFIISMGAGVSLAHGISRVSNQEVIVFIGDSTFFHAGMPGLLNYKFNNGRSPLVIILDNKITAMTGHQPHPGSGITGMGEKVEPIKIEDVVKAFGAEVRVVNAFNQKELIAALNELRKIKSPRVLVSKGECRLLTKRKFRKKGVPLPKFEIVDQKAFEKSRLLEEFACPAMERTKKGYRINPDLCWGCGVCVQICPQGIKLRQ